MKKNPNKKTVRETKPQRIIDEPLEISQKREKELLELDRIAKFLVKRDFELTETREEQIRELQEVDRIAKMLVRRDFALSEMREKREVELKELEKKTQELEASKKALKNMLEDTEELKRLAEEEKEKTSAIITNFADGLLVFNKEQRVFLINPLARSFFGVRGRDVIGKSTLELSALRALKPLASILGEEIKGIYRKELKLSEKLIIEVSTVPIMGRKGTWGTLVILHDIAREKMVERLKTEFVSLTAHQLRTPLSAIKWTLKMLLDGDLGEITEEQREFIKKTYKSNERMVALINDLLNVTRIEEGRYLYKKTLANMKNMVQFVINSYKEEVKKRNIQLEFEKPKKKLPQVFVDVEKIRLAIQNLLDNAVRYTHPRGKVVVSLRSGKNKIEFSVKDTGVGIPANQRARVFTKFFRAANVMRMETEGSGLGLFIAKNIIEAHGGRIWFESKEGEGSTFYFNLPLKEQFAQLLKEF